MKESEKGSENFTGNNNISDITESTPISEMAEMISIYYDEIKAIALNLEKENYPLPQDDINELHKSLMEYARLGAEFTKSFQKKAKKLSPGLSETKKNTLEDI